MYIHGLVGLKERAYAEQIYYATWLIDSTLVDQTNGYIEGHRYEPFVVNVGSTSQPLFQKF